MRQITTGSTLDPLPHGYISLTPPIHTSAGDIDALYTEGGYLQTRAVGGGYTYVYTYVYSEWLDIILDGVEMSEECLASLRAEDLAWVNENLLNCRR